MSRVPARLVAEATKLFAANGYGGTSVRAICAAADTNLNAVSYHFGGKKGLYQAVLKGVGDRRLASAQRLLDLPARDVGDLETRLLLFAEECLVAWLEEPGVLNILLAELQQGFPNCDEEAMQSLEAQSQVLIGFLTSARDDGLLAEDLDIAMVAGGLIERLNNQVLFSDTLKQQFGASVEDPDYRRAWVGKVISLLLFGAVAR